jgi:Tol biopolymer transport system component
VSEDGRFVVFESSARLVAQDTDNFNDIYLRDLQANTIVRISTKADNSEVGASSYSAQISPDGRFVVFESAAQLVAEDTDNRLDIYRKDLRDGTLIRVSTKADGSPTGGSSFSAQTSADGRFVIFATNGRLVSADTDDNLDVYLKDLQTNTLSRISTKADGSPAGGDVGSA